MAEKSYRKGEMIFRRAFWGTFLWAATVGLCPARSAEVILIGVVEDDDQFSNVLPVSVQGSADLDVVGSRPGLYADVYEGTSLAGRTSFNSIRGGSSVTYALSGMSGEAFTLIWGTVDVYNVIQVVGPAGQQDVVTGQDILNLMDNPAWGVSNVIVKIRPDAGWEKIILTSQRNSFEHAFNPPELEYQLSVGLSVDRVKDRDKAAEIQSVTGNEWLLAWSGQDD